MEWISVENAFPAKNEICWVCDIDNRVDFGEFTLNGMLDNPAWCMDSEYSVYWSIEKVKYWMPYFTPLPPEE
jgi:uncharacterized protein DUF551